MFVTMSKRSIGGYIFAVSFSKHYTLKEQFVYIDETSAFIYITDSELDCHALLCQMCASTNMFLAELSYILMYLNI